MSEVPLHVAAAVLVPIKFCSPLQGYLAHKKTLTPIGPRQGPMYSPTVGSEEGGVSYERGAPVRELVVIPALRSVSLLLSNLELSDTKVHEPQVRARLRTAAHLSGVIVRFSIRVCSSSKTMLNTS